MKKQLIMIVSTLLLLPLFVACGNKGIGDENQGASSNETPPVTEPAQKKTTRLSGDEVLYNGIGSETMETELVDKLGKPLRTEDESMGEGMGYTKYFYEDAEYDFFYDQLSSTQHMLSYIIINSSSAQEGPRGLKIGDTLEQVLAQYPQEKDWQTDVNGSFYGEDTFNGNAGAVYKDENGTPNLIILTPVDIVPFMRIDITENKVSSYTLCFELH
jgi:hypothetical protein